jgi:hypothetical protein
MSTAMVCGCGQKELPTKKTYSVQGKLSIKGEPVAFAIINFEPKDGKGFPATAYTDKNGVFNGARTFANNEMDGMVPGDYDVKLEGYNAVAAVKFLGEKPNEGEKPTKIPPEYVNPGETVTIEAVDDNQINIDLK